MLLDFVRRLTQHGDPFIDPAWHVAVGTELAGQDHVQPRLRLVDHVGAVAQHPAGEDLAQARCGRQANPQEQYEQLCQNCA